MTVLVDGPAQVAPVDAVLERVGRRWGAHCLVEISGGRLSEHFVHPADVPAFVVDAVLAKQVGPLLAGSGRPRALGLAPGGVVVVRGKSGSIVTVPMTSDSWLWLVLPRDVRPRLEELADAARCVDEALRLDIDPAEQAGHDLQEALTSGDPLPSHLRPSGPWRLVAVDSGMRSPSSVVETVRRSSSSHVAAARMGNEVLVAVADGDESQLVALGLRLAVSPLLTPGARTGAPLRQVRACLSHVTAAQAAFTEDHRATLLLEALRPALVEASQDDPDPLAPLGGSDADLRATLKAWIAAHGDSPAAARALGIHANTLRYRLHRVRELLTVDLDDPDVRLALHLRLRLGL